MPSAYKSTRTRPFQIFLTFVSIFLVVLGMSHYYVGRQLISAGPWSAAAKIWLWLVLWLCMILTPTAMVLGRFVNKSIVKLARKFAYGWLGAHFINLVSAAVVDLIYAVLGLGSYQPRWPYEQFWATVILGDVVGVYGLASARRVVLKELTWPLASLPRGAEIRLVQLSDVHLSDDLNAHFLSRILQTARRAKPHALVITGDLVEGSVEQIGRELEPFREFVKDIPIYFSTGNHEYYHGGPQWEAFAASLGIHVLHNSHVLLDGNQGTIVLGGITDLQAAQFHPGHGPDVQKAFAGSPEDLPRILLSHQPRAAKLAAGHKVALQLSGHTHGGQMFPFNLLVRLQQPVVAGLRNIADTWVYTSRGTGYWGPPFRVFAPPEVTLIRLLGPG